MNCQSLKKIEISNIHGNKVNDAGYLFRDCVNLESIDLANFKAPYNVYIMFICIICLKIVKH